MNIYTRRKEMEDLPNDKYLIDKLLTDRKKERYLITLDISKLLTQDIAYTLTFLDSLLTSEESHVVINYVLNSYVIEPRVNERQILNSLDSMGLSLNKLSFNAIHSLLEHLDRCFYDTVNSYFVGKDLFGPFVSNNDGSYENFVSKISYINIGIRQIVKCTLVITRKVDDHAPIILK